jgi:hypothetical protein
MAHFAQLDTNNIVTKVIVIDNKDIIDPETGKENEQLGINLCRKLLGDDTNWKQTSYNGSFRKNYAGEGYVWDEGRKAFISQQPYPSWVLDETTCLWQPPVAPIQSARLSDGTEENNSSARRRWSEVEYQNTGDGWIMLDDPSSIPISD